MRKEKLSKLEQKYAKGYRGGYRDGYEAAIIDIFKKLDPPRAWSDKKRQLLSHIYDLEKWWNSEVKSSTGYDFPPEFQLDQALEDKKRVRYGCVYFINVVDTNLLKVGYTYGFRNRFNQIKNNVPSDLIVLGKDWTLEPRKLERAYHSILKPYRLKNGEWFDIPNMIEVINKWRNELKDAYQVDEDYEEYE